MLRSINKVLSLNYLVHQIRNKNNGVGGYKEIKI